MISTVLKYRHIHCTRLEVIILIMCVQYHGGVQYCGGYHEYRGGYLEYREGVQYHGGYHDKCGGYLEYHGVFSTMGIS